MIVNKMIANDCEQCNFYYSVSNVESSKYTFPCRRYNRRSLSKNYTKYFFFCPITSCHMTAHDYVDVGLFSAALNERRDDPRSFL